MTLVLDGSAAIGWTFEDEQTDELRDLALRVAREGAHVPAHFKLEFANAILSATRRGRATRAEAAGHLADLDALPIDVDERAAQQASGAVFALAERHRLSIYDSAYLELAIRIGAELATCDSDLAAAAQAEGVSLVGVGS